MQAEKDFFAVFDGHGDGIVLKDYSVIEDYSNNSSDISYSSTD